MTSQNFTSAVREFMEIGGQSVDWRNPRQAALYVGCLCPACCTTPAPKYTEAWRLECEARSMLKMNREARNDYIDAVKKRRGIQSADRLKGEFLRIWEAR